MELIRLSLLWLFAAAVAYSDFRYRKVSNRLIVAAAACGLICSACCGWTSLRSGLMGLALGFTLLLPAFSLRMVGGGDVKTLAVMGLFTGLHLLWVSFIRGAVVGGLAALMLLAARRLQRGKRSSLDNAGVWTLPYAGILALCAALSTLW